MKLGILKEFTGYESNYIKACEDLKVDYEIIDIISNDWIDNILKSNCDGFLVRPSFAKDVWKRMYDEKLYFISHVLKKPIYPDYYSLFIYENKKNMAYFLKLNDIPHPKTWIFYDKEEALNFVEKYDKYPLVFKPNIGSGALGIKFMNKNQAKKIINKIFTKWKFFNFGYTKWYKTKFIFSVPIMDDKQYNFVIFQEKLDVKWEWRIIRIGESFFGHQKLANGKFHSGSGKVGWVKPPEELLNLVKRITDENGFRSMDIDIFETLDNKFYVNELQAIFGSYDNSQMYIDGKPGRYLFKDDEWIFEEGYFNQNGSFNLRVEDFLKILNNQ
ncbi:hypothetical protein OF820_08850 [Oceanotoga sp. DSM 15011]|uniref:ATP-grasp domain-containing protein n=1 Tax=Oceanotoga sp. DSM 15011 TaxID=2984951 RepID=UPI0021F466F0|nr:hypothetical protein [Oceanotoga sp. DSM 15011]UYO99180.1 hypothetical protein OF820_08850 [Oceanotoga sp. DSM 15011]